MTYQLNIINEKKYPLTSNFKVKLVKIIELVEKNINLYSLAWLDNSKLSKVEFKQKKWLLNLVLIDEKESQQLNQQYSQKDYPANALTFPFARFYQKELDNCEELGDIFLCYPLIQKQVRDTHQKNKKIQLQLLEKETLLLFIHGVLHLLGCDHQTKAEKELIFALQEKLFDLQVKKTYD